MKRLRSSGTVSSIDPSGSVNVLQQITDMLRGIQSDVSQIIVEYNREVYETIGTLPQGVAEIRWPLRDDSINPRVNNLDGANILVDTDASSTADGGRFWLSTSQDQRPKTVKESLTDLYSYVGSAIDSVRSEMGVVGSSASPMAAYNVSVSAPNLLEDGVDSIVFDGTTIEGVSSGDGTITIRAVAGSNEVIADPETYGAAGNGTTDDHSSVSSAVTALSALGGGKLYLRPGSVYRLASDLTIPSSVLLTGTGHLKPDNTKTITVSGSIDVGHTQIFDTSLCVTSGGVDASDSPSTLDVMWFGATGTGIAGYNDRLAIQHCINAMPASGGKIEFPLPPSRYLVESTVDFTAKTGFLLIGNGSQIYASGGTGFGQTYPIIDFTDCTDARIQDLDTSSTGFSDAKRPSCAIAIGRSTTAATGSRMFFERCRFSGKCAVGTLYRSGSELTTFKRCRFTNTNNAPAYYDDAADEHNICGRNGVLGSNTECHFHNCDFHSYIGDNDGKVIWLAGPARDIVFRSCYATVSAVSGGRGHFIHIEPDSSVGGSHARAERILIDDFRMETNDDDLINQVNTRAIYIANSYGVEELVVRDLYFPANGSGSPPSAIIEINQAVYQEPGIHKGTVEVPEASASTAVIKITDGVVETSRLVVATSDDILVESDGTIQKCTVHVADNSPNPVKDNGGVIKDVRVVTRAPDVLSEIPSSVSTSGTGEDNLQTAVLAQDSDDYYRCIKILAAGTKTGSNGDKTIKFYVGSASVTFNATANDTNDWRFEGTLAIYATAEQRLSWVGFNGTTVTQGYEALTQDLSAGDVTLKCTGECAHTDDTITQTMFVVEAN